MFDRLYKELKFPTVINELLDCPGLLRLRDVRMANNQFVAFPSFATVTRYEHSLGVCFLAGICADTLKLDEKDTIELMIACLYHDVGTPPFAHAMEEVLQVKFGFDHEINLKNLIMGTTGEFDGDMAQIYQGEGLKIKSVCQSKRVRDLGIDIHRIAKLAAGDRSEYLSPLINGSGIDLDNIDNIFRASSAMGIIPTDGGDIAISLAKSFIIDGGKIKYNGLYLSEINEWRRVRDIQYTAIFESVEDFSYQTMIKKAILMLLEDDDQTQKLNINSWKLTDSSITHEYLLEHAKSRDIIRRVLLCRPFTCLGILYIQGECVAQYLNSHLQEIEDEVSNYFVSTLGITAKKIASINTNVVVANFFPDKRKRQFKDKAVLWGKEVKIDSSVEVVQGALLGLFTPFSNSNFKSIQKNNTFERKIVSFRKNNLEDIINILSKGILAKFEISRYGGEDNRKSYTDTESSQLGFF
ncbi:HD domain-containing protein [Acetobacterium sp.]|uniref:HD domain-containing protein n=1 Tax=Acetobacterium sp. TaxID=1872094 RepID=UPI0035945C28